MSGEYKKLKAKPTDRPDSAITVFCHRNTFLERRDEVEEWIEILMGSEGFNDYELEISDSMWSEATIRRDRLFEEHF